MAAKHVGLGRGLGALIKDASPTSSPEPSNPRPAGALTLPLQQIQKSPWQPRRAFEPLALADLVSSIKERGVLQPLLVRKTSRGGRDAYELIAGERRLRAAQEAGLREVPVLVMDVSDREALEIALVENLQREDLNLIEEAEGYQALAEKFQLTQEQIADRVGKARATVANALRLLSLSDVVKAHLAEGRLSAGHAKVLLGLDIQAERDLLADRVTREGLSVRSLERIVARLRKAPRKPRAQRDDIPASHLQHLTDRLHRHLGTSVRVVPCKTLANGKKTRGSIEIDFYSNDEMDRLLTLLGLSDTL